MKKESFVIKTLSTSLDNARVLLEGQLVIRNAAIIKKELLSALTNSQNLELIFRNISKADTAFFQLLIALQKSAATHEKTVSFDVESSDYLASVIKSNGFERNLASNFEA